MAPPRADSVEGREGPAERVEPEARAEPEAPVEQVDQIQPAE